MLAFKTTLCSNNSSLKRFALGEFTIVAKENNLSTGADDGKEVLYYRNIFLIDW